MTPQTPLFKQVTELLKKKVQNLIAEDLVSPLFWEDFAREVIALVGTARKGRKHCRHKLH